MHKLRLLRERKGWTQQDLAHEAGVSASSVANIEQNTTSPTLATRRKLLQALGASFRRHVSIFGPVPQKGPK